MSLSTTLFTHNLRDRLTVADIVVGPAVLAPWLSVAVLRHMTASQTLGAYCSLEAVLSVVTKFATSHTCWGATRRLHMTEFTALVTSRHKAVFCRVTTAIALCANDTSFKSVTVLGALVAPICGAVCVHVTSATTRVAPNLGTLADAVVSSSTLEARKVGLGGSYRMGRLTWTPRSVSIANDKLGLLDDTGLVHLRGLVLNARHDFYE